MDIRAIVQRNAWMDTAVARAFMRAAFVRPSERCMDPTPREDADLRWCRMQRYGALEARR